MVRFSLTLLAAALLQTATSLPLVEERQLTPTGFHTGSPTEVPTGFPTANPTSLPSGFPTGLPTGIPTSFPTATGFPGGFPTGFPGTNYPVPTGYPHHHHPHRPHNTHPEGQSGRAIPLPEKRNLPVTPKWLRWLPFENINM
ncbi:hypothetical protein F4859DRAFT_477762 [Xylaria cf. heliscus]|nr:hypothetical protein F4859DRAFT_477762 [Xylaria cf. heliscus]